MANQTATIDTLERNTPQQNDRNLMRQMARQGLSSSGAIIEVKNGAKRFGKDKLVVHDLNFEVRPGQIFCLLGPSGSGKSTTMRLLTGLYRPSEGEVNVFGQPPHRFRKKWRERMGYMPQQFVLFPEISVWGNINFVASVYGMSWFNRRQKIQRALDFVDLLESRDKLASQLSGGMQRRLQLAATLVHNPSLIFVDEPTAGIDPILRAKFWDHFHELRDQKRTLFVTTQYVTEADYCDVVAILNKGRILALGAPEAIRHYAFGGEIINLSLENVSRQAIDILRRIPGVKYVQFINTEELKLTVEDSSETLPQIVSGLQEASISLKTIEPYRPDFEEVFVRLMEQDRSEEPNEALDTVQNSHRATRREAGPVPEQNHRPAASPAPVNAPRQAQSNGQPPQPIRGQDGVDQPTRAYRPAPPPAAQPQPQPQPRPVDLEKFNEQSTQPFPTLSPDQINHNLRKEG